MAALCANMEPMSVPMDVSENDGAASLLTANASSSSAAGDLLIKKATDRCAALSHFSPSFAAVVSRRRLLLQWEEAKTVVYLLLKGSSCVRSLPAAHEAMIQRRL